MLSHSIPKITQDMGSPVFLCGIVVMKIVYWCNVLVQESFVIHLLAGLHSDMTAVNTESYTGNEGCWNTGNRGHSTLARSISSALHCHAPGPPLQCSRPSISMLQCPPFLVLQALHFHAPLPSISMLHCPPFPCSRPSISSAISFQLYSTLSLQGFQFCERCCPKRC